MKYYKRLANAVDDAHYKLIPIETNYWADGLVDHNKNYFLSIFDYTEEQYQKFLTSGSIAGIRDVSTHDLVFDFDAEPDDFTEARTECLDLISRLKNHGIKENNISLAFSGSRGFSLIVNSEQRLTIDEVKQITSKLTVGMSTIDNTIYINSGIFRIIGTKNLKSGLFKTSITLSDLESLSDDELRLKASSLDTVEDIPVDAIKLPKSILNFIEEKKEKEIQILNDYEISFTQKPKGWSNCKWALAQGYQVESGSRKVKLVSLVATCKALNFTKEQAYYMAKNSYEKGLERYGGEPFNKDELWNDVVERVYSPTWNGGTYTCRDGKTQWLTDLCNSLGRHKCKTANMEIVTASEVFDLFQNYAENFEKNVLKTGLDRLDQECKLLVGTSNGILAPPGVGKTTLSLGILNHNSKQNNHCVFFSYDMFHSMVYLRLIQKHFGFKQDRVFDIFKHEKALANKIRARIEEEYQNVHFCFKSGQTADEIYETILDTEDKTGHKVKLAMVDYNELVISGVNDPTQSSAQVAQRLRQIANDASCCVVTLLQPSKVFSNPSDEITTYQGAKGSGAIAQSLSLMLSLSRPGFHPRKPEEDRFLTVNALKHRQGPLFTIDLYWNGLSGEIRELNEEEAHDLQMIRDRNAAERDNNSGGFG